MLQELKNSIKKLPSDEMFVGTIMLLFTVTVLFFVILWLVSVSNTNDLKARCKSLGGEYGKGKCFKDGKGV